VRQVGQSANLEAALAFAMKIRTGRREQTIALRMARPGTVFIDRVAAGHHFDAAPAEIAELCE